jgi:transposase
MLANWRKRVIDELSQRVYEMVIWPDHFLRQVNAKVEFSFINELCAPAYHNGTGKGGRAAEAPERVFRALLLLVLYGLRSETCLVREIGVNLAFRWFCGLGLLEPMFDHSLF